MKTQKLQNEIDTYSYSTGVYSRAFNNKSKLLCSTQAKQLPEFCKLVHQNKGKEDCQNSYLYGSIQTKKLGEAYIYFCPYGLVNWSVPVLEAGKMNCFLTGGPVLMHQVDDLLIEEICQQNPNLKKQLDEMKNKLKKIQIIDTTRVKYLSELLMKLSRSLMVKDINTLEQKKQFNQGAKLIGETIQNLKSKGDVALRQAYPLKKENKLINNVKIGDKDKSQEILNEILGIIYFKSGNDFSLLKSRAIELMVVLARAAIEVGADLEAIFGLEYQYFGSINNTKDINQLSHVLTQVLNKFIDNIFSITNVKNKSLIYKAMNYIRENYNQNIQLSSVAKYIGLSNSYFSNFFKTETGMTYTEYLNLVRIENAKKMLKEGHSLVTTAQKIGFNDQSYFSRIFKKIEGKPPGKWQKQDNI